MNLAVREILALGGIAVSFAVTFYYIWIDIKIKRKLRGPIRNHFKSLIPFSALSSLIMVFSFLFLGILVREERTAIEIFSKNYFLSAVFLSMAVIWTGSAYNMVSTLKDVRKEYLTFEGAN